MVKKRVEEVRDVFETSFKGVSKKCDCAKDKAEVMNVGDELRAEVESMHEMCAVLKGLANKNMQQIEGKADKAEMDQVNLRMKEMPS